MVKNGQKMQTFNCSLAISGFLTKKEALKFDPSKHVLPVAEFAPSLQHRNWCHSSNRNNSPHYF